MRQIPTSGEYCGECPCLDIARDRCQLYTHADGNFFTELELNGNYRKRLPQCLSDKTQALSHSDRAAIHARGYEDCMEDRKNFN